MSGFDFGDDWARVEGDGPVALVNEHAAERYYREFANRSIYAGTAAVATRFADEERDHAAQLERLIAALPANGLHLLVEDDEPHMPE